MINEKKIPDEIQPAKPNWRRRLLISALKSPISTILILAFLYFAFQAYVLQLSPTVNKFYMFGVLFLWVFCMWPKMSLKSFCWRLPLLTAPIPITLIQPEKSPGASCPAALGTKKSENAKKKPDFGPE